MFTPATKSSDYIYIFIYNKLFNPKIYIPENFPEKIKLGHKLIDIKVSMMNNDENLPALSVQNQFPIFLFNKNNNSTLVAAQFLHQQINYKKCMFIGVDDKSKKNKEGASDYLSNYIKKHASIYLEMDDESIKKLESILYPALKLIFDLQSDCSHEYPIPNSLEEMKILFEELYTIRTSKCNHSEDKDYYDKYLKLLREAALQAVNKQQSNMTDKLEKKIFLENVLSLAIINKHLYMGKFAVIKNTGPTKTYSTIEAWKNKLDTELAKNIELSNPKDFRQIGR